MKYIPLHQCHICRNLAENEYGAYPVMPDRPAKPLAPAAYNLEPAGNQGRYEIKRCPNCNVHYRYHEHYEYDVTGSEDEVYLTRLTPTEASDFLSQRELETRLKRCSEELSSSHPITREYAAKCLVSHYLQLEAAEQIIDLVNEADVELELAIWRYLYRLTEEWWLLDNRPLIKRIAETAVGNPDQRPESLIEQIIWRCRES